MSIIIGFILLIMLLLLIYMIFRFFKRKSLLTIIAVCIQVFILSIASLSFFNNVDVFKIYFIETGYILGITIPSCFLFYDYFSMIREIKKHNIYNGLIKKVKNEKKNDLQSNDVNIEKLNSISESKPVSVILDDLNIDDDSISKAIRKNILQAQLYFNSKDYNNALDIYKKITSVIKTSPSIFYNMANILFHLEQYEQSAEYYKKAIFLYNKIKKHLKHKHSILQRSNKRKLKTRKTLNKVILQQSLAYYNLGNSLYKLKRFNEAVNNYRQSLSLNKDSYEANWNMAIALVYTGEKGKAVSYYKKLIFNDRNNYILYYLLGKLYFKLNMYNEAIDTLKKCLKLNSFFPDAYEYLGLSLAKKFKYKDAVSAFLRLSEMRPESTDTYYNLGMMLYYDGQKKKAIENFKRVIEKNPCSYKAYYNMAISYDELGQYDMAIESFKKVIEMKIDFVDAYNNLGILLSTQERHMEALDVYIKGLKKNPDQYSLLFNMGVTLSEMGKNEQAVEAYKKAIDIKTDEYEIYYHLGSSFMKLKEYDKAIECYKIALKIKPEDSVLFYNLSIVYSLLHMYDIAIDNLKKAIELNTTLKEDAKSNGAFNSIKHKSEFKKLIS